MTRTRALVLAVAALGAGCSGLKQKPAEQQNPLTVDMLNYRNGLALLRDGCPGADGAAPATEGVRSLALPKARGLRP